MQNVENTTFSLHPSVIQRTIAARVRLGWRDPAIRFPVVIFTVVRVMTLLIALFSVRVSAVNNPYRNDQIYLTSLQARHVQGPLATLIDPWHRWDTGWYLKVAVQGYTSDDGSIIFAPLYPTLIALVSLFVGDGLLAGLLISSIACLIFLILFYKLAQSETGSDGAARAALLTFVAFPTAFYMLAAYTEATFMVCVVGALLAGKQRRWWWAALLALGAASTRLQGWVLFFPLGWMAFAESPRFWQAAGVSWQKRFREAIPRLAAIGTGPSAVLGFFTFLAVAKLGSVTDAYGKYWGLVVQPPWSPVIDAIAKINSGKAAPTEVANLVALAFIILMCLVSIRVLPMRLHLYLWPTLVLILLRYYPLYLLNGTMRYVLDFFPIFITLGVLLLKHFRLRLLLIVGGLLLQLLMLFLFTQWAWIS